jgi:hypothetical protein
MSVPLVLERLVALEPELKLKDPFRAFGFRIAGSLFHDRCHPAEVVPPKDLATLFAETTYYDDVLGVGFFSLQSLHHSLVACFTGIAYPG